MVKHQKHQNNCLKNSILLIYLNDIHYPPPSTAARLLSIPPAINPLHSYLLENNQKVALPASLIKNGAFTLSLEDRQYQYINQQK